MLRIKERFFNHCGLIFLILILVFFIGVGFLPYFLKSKSVAVILSGQDEVSISTKLPITDASAKSLNPETVQDGIIGYAEFSIKLEENIDTPVEYEIYLTDVTESDLFKYDYVKVYLTDGEGIPYNQFAGNSSPSYRDLRVSLDEPSKRILLTGKISYGEVQKFKLRIWVADTYVLNNEEKEFKGKISVRTIS